MQRVSRRHWIQLATGGVLATSRPLAAAQTITEDAGYIRLGGIDQWVAIRGHDRHNPALLYLHGGPGEALSPFLAQFDPWERDFTVVYWDQRGSGKTYERNGSTTPDMTTDRLVEDTIEIARHVCHRLPKQKVILVGQSWGSILGIHVVKRRPELFYAFVGTGVPVSFTAAIEDRARWARQRATIEGDQAVIKALDDAAALPSEKRVNELATASIRWALSPPDIKFKEQVLGEYADAASTKVEVVEWRAGAAFSGSTIGRANVDFDLRKLGPEMPIPFFVIQGREDHIAGFESTKRYVDEIRAPIKAFIPINGGHYACFTDATEFVGALCTHVRRLAI